MKITIDEKKLKEIIKQSELTVVKNKFDNIISGLIVVLLVLHISSLFLIQNELSYFIYFILISFSILTILALIIIKKRTIKNLEENKNDI